MKCEFGDIFEKSSNIKVQENPSSESRFARCSRTGRQTDMTKLTACFRNFSNAPKNWNIFGK